jgi:hypothetical protein
MLYIKEGIINTEVTKRETEINGTYVQENEERKIKEIFQFFTHFMYWKRL